MKFDEKVEEILEVTERRLPLHQVEVDVIKNAKIKGKIIRLDEEEGIVDFEMNPIKGYAPTTITLTKIKDKGIKYRYALDEEQYDDEQGDLVFDRIYISEPARINNFEKQLKDTLKNVAL